MGRIFDSLKQLEIDDNTIVIYASDNGRGPGRTPQQKIRGRKLSTYEGGLRVPAIAWGPGLGVQAGRKSAAVVAAMDWYPTLATFAGIQVPADRVIDGRDISPLLKGETEIVPTPEMQKSLNASVPLRRRWEPPGARWRNSWEFPDFALWAGAGRDPAPAGSLGPRTPRQVIRGRAGAPQP